MSVKTRLVLTDPNRDATALASIINLAQGDNHAARALAEYLKGVAGGVNRSEIVVNLGAVQASGSVTFTGAPSNDETLSIANVTFTAKTSGASGNEFNIDGTNNTAANLAAAINASSDLSKIVSASAASGVVTLTAHVPGKAGNAIELSESLSNATVTAFTNGAEGTETVLDLD